MHELSIALAVVEQVEEVAEANAIDRVGVVTVAVGRLSGVVPSALELSFDLATAGTALEGATLVIEPRPVVVRCDVGGHELTLDAPDLWCAEHGCVTPEVLSGRELQILSFQAAGPAPGPAPDGREEAHAASR